MEEQVHGLYHQDESYQKGEYDQEPQALLTIMAELYREEQLWNIRWHCFQGVVRVIKVC